MLMFVNTKMLMLAMTMLMLAMLILGQRVPKPPKSIGFQNGGVDFNTVVSSIKEIADAIERLRNPSDIDLFKLRLDYISRMLVTLDIPEEIVNIMSSVHQQLERLNYSPDVQYHAPASIDLHTTLCLRTATFYFLHG
jgi:hypothetical protein